jgi:valyl-tRNA synthetase
VAAPDLAAAEHRPGATVSDLPKAYEPADVEADLYADWELSGLFHAEADDAGEPFSIVIPPPNVTGSLHVGHALDTTIQDVIIRRERMRGRNTVWVPGTDHAGIATQMVVEKQLAAEGLTRHDLGRDAFLERVWRWRDESGGTILRQLRVLGCSLDWEREAFTFDEARNVAVTKVFVELHQQGLIYRGTRLINWDPALRTALSDIEVEHLDVQGELVHFRYELVGDDGAHIEVATTRAETMLGDTAIAVHPEDERYAQLVGREVRHPFLDRTFPIVADDYVDPSFGTGAVKITPAHDPNDYALGQRHGLEMIDVMDDGGAMNAEAGRFAGMDRFAARAAVKVALAELGLLGEVKAHPHQVGHSSRSGAIVEPRLSDQWFVAVRPLADRAAQAVRDGRVTFVPERMTRPFLEWLDGLHDWCISRQLWWGHRIPAWYGPDGEVRVQADAPDGEGWVQDEDVLDTWFSSQLWPFTVFGWPEATPDLARWYPTSTLVTGYDINTFWVARMLMIGLWFTDEVPFRVVHNHGLVRDEHGKKMSKSFGNVIDPLDLVGRYGADATRFALLRSAAPGTDVPLAEEWVEGAKRFVNKFWNAARFAIVNLDGQRPGALPPDERLTLEDRWLLDALATAHAEVDAAYTAYDWPVVARGIYRFVWDEFADWYLEAVKGRIYGDDVEAARDARAVLAHVLELTLRLASPLLPFVTEAAWRALTGAAGGRASLMVAAWPEQAGRIDVAAREEFARVQGLVREVHRFRSQLRVAPSVRIELDVLPADAAAHATLVAHAGLVASLAGLGRLDVVDELEDLPGTSSIVFPSGRARVPLAGVIDLEAELARLAAERDRVLADVERLDAKLANAGFVERAPADVVAKERAKREAAQRAAEELTAQIATFAGRP